jgi:hypothetical protein
MVVPPGAPIPPLIGPLTVIPPPLLIYRMTRVSPHSMVLLWMLLVPPGPVPCRQQPRRIPPLQLDLRQRPLPPTILAHMTSTSPMGILAQVLADLLAPLFPRRAAPRGLSSPILVRLLRRDIVSKGPRPPLTHIPRTVAFTSTPAMTTYDHPLFILAAQS